MSDPIKLPRRSVQAPIAGTLPATTNFNQDLERLTEATETALNNIQTALDQLAAAEATLAQQQAELVAQQAALAAQVTALQNVLNGTTPFTALNSNGNQVGDFLTSQVSGTKIAATAIPSNVSVSNVATSTVQVSGKTVVSAQQASVAALPSTATLSDVITALNSTLAGAKGFGWMAT